jgi:D-aminoacyl-tRNA deacylase
VRGLVQRVSSASVTSTVEGGTTSEGGAIAEETGRIGRGLVLFVGVTHDDEAARAAKLAEKVWHLRVFEDDDGAMNRSCADVGGGVLVVSQFTLYGDARKGRRPSFVAAARPELAEPLVEAVVDRLRALGAEVATGRFRTHMDVALVNDGPVTLLLEV